MSVEIINPWCAFKNLYDSSFACNLEDLAFSDRAISKTYINDLSIFRELNIIKDDKRAINFDDCSIVDSWCNIVISGDGLEISVEKLAFMHIGYFNYYS